MTEFEIALIATIFAHQACHFQIDFDYEKCVKELRRIHKLKIDRYQDQMRVTPDTKEVDPLASFKQEGNKND